MELNRINIDMYTHSNKWGFLEITTDYKNFVKLEINREEYWNFNNIEEINFQIGFYKNQEGSIFYDTDIEWAIKTLQEIIKKWNKE